MRNFDRSRPSGRPIRCLQVLVLADHKAFEEEFGLSLIVQTVRPAYANISG
ncbi:hypothetical protein HDF16_006159 [Granulicella aggregans]|uniref:Uncharacterized protein n=1 Tax=Granulicella aggregans TaxID=474949 RepID=A0A7W7ZKJ0_9BACT|nr:hypothetical protein [Granulicella aggregans]